METKIQKIIDKVKPFIQMHGGNVELLEVKDETVKLKVTGACAHCSLAHLTYNEMVGSLIKEEVPEIKNIIIEN